MSSLETMLYRSKTARVRCPEISIAMRSGTPARTMLRIAVRRRSWKSFPFTPALRQADFQALRKSPMGLPQWWKTRRANSVESLATIASKLRPGRQVPAFAPAEQHLSYGGQANPAPATNFFPKQNKGLHGYARRDFF